MNAIIMFFRKLADATYRRIKKLWRKDILEKELALLMLDEIQDSDMYHVDDLRIAINSKLVILGYSKKEFLLIVNQRVQVIVENTKRDKGKLTNSDEDELMDQLEKKLGEQLRKQKK